MLLTLADVIGRAVGRPGVLEAGIAFGMVGSTFQTMLRNPLASPDMIGVTSGASVAVVYCILVLKTDGSCVAIAAVVSGLMVSMAIYFPVREAFLVHL